WRVRSDELQRLVVRLCSLGLMHVEDLASAGDSVPPVRRRKATLADDVPTCPGVYLFLGPRQEVLYVGTASNLRRRVRSYFTAAGMRKRIGEMVDLATAVRPIPYTTPLEAAVRDLRATAEHDPRYNRRTGPPRTGRSPAPPHWRRPCPSGAPSPSTTRATTAAPAPRSGAPGSGSPPRPTRGCRWRAPLPRSTAEHAWVRSPPGLVLLLLW